MSDKLRKQITVELDQLNNLVEVHRLLIEKCNNTPPTEIEISALAGMLHSFYSGIENIFKRICIELRGSLPVGLSWHRDLLDLMSEPEGVSTPIVSMELRWRLEEYLKFRHFFRQAYSFQFEWDKLSSLVLGCESVLRKFEAELQTLLRGGD